MNQLSQNKSIYINNHEKQQWLKDKKDMTTVLYTLTECRLIELKESQHFIDKNHQEGLSFHQFTTFLQSMNSLSF